MTSPTEVQTTAVLVTRGRTDFLERTLAGLAAQTRRPDRVVVVDAGGDPEAVAAAITAAWPDGGRPRLVAAAARTFGAGVRAGLAEEPGAEQEAWVWLLHDDSAPAPDALERLLAAVERAPSVAIAGCKQVDWDDPGHLLEVGVATSRYGRRMTDLDETEVDQGQHDGREDVLAVGLAGALVRRDVWDALRGPDPALGPYGDGLDLCRRARLAGHRVVVVPAAVVAHARGSLRGARVRPGWDARRSAQARREAFLHGQLTSVPALAVPAVAVLAVVAGLVRAAWMLVVKEPHLVTAELFAPWAVLSAPGRVAAARRSAARTAVLRRSALRPLQHTTRDVLRQVRDRRLAATEARRTRQAPSELELRELARLRTRRRAGLAAVLVGGLALAGASTGGLVGRVLAGDRLVGGTWPYADADLATAWRAATAWWVADGLGRPAPPDPLTVLLTPVAALGSLDLAGELVLLGGLPLAALGGWAAAGAATRSVALRLWAAAVWAAAPALLAGLDQVRLGAVVTHLALPFAVLGLARALGVARVDAVASGLVGAQRAGAEGEGAPSSRPEPVVATADPSPGAAAAAGLALGLVTAGTPALLPAVVATVLGVAVLRPRRRLWWAVVPSLVLHGPTLALVVTGDWRALLGEPGAPVAARAPVAWAQLLGWPVAPGSVVLLAAGGVLVVAAALALAVRPPAVRVVRLGWLVAALGLATAVLVGHLPVAVADGELTAGWTGGALSLATAGLLTAALLGAGRVRAALSGVQFGWRQGGAGLLALLAAAAPVALVVGGWGTGWDCGGGAAGGGVTGGLTATGRVVPAVGSQLQASADDVRVLVLVPAEVLTGSLLTGDGRQLTELRPAASTARVTGPPLAPVAVPADDADLELTTAIAHLGAGVATAAEELAALGVGAVLLPPQAEAALSGTLDATAGLERVTETEAGTIWRVATDGTAAWARLVRGGAESFGRSVGGVPADGRVVDALIDAGAADRLVVLAERADPGWRAWLDGRPLRAVETGWRQAFEVGADGGRLVIRHQPPEQRPWQVAQAVVLGAAVLLAVPTRRRSRR